MAVSNVRKIDKNKVSTIQLAALDKLKNKPAILCNLSPPKCTPQRKSDEGWLVFRFESVLLSCKNCLCRKKTFHSI